jgi:formate hydrogenlyase subunit 4
MNVYLYVYISLYIYLSVYLPTHLSLSLSIYIYIYGSTALVDLGRFFSSLIIFHRLWDSLDEGSARRKAATYT